MADDERLRKAKSALGVAKEENKRLGQVIFATRPVVDLLIDALETLLEVVEEKKP